MSEIIMAEFTAIQVDLFPKTVPLHPSHISDIFKCATNNDAHFSPQMAP